MAKIISEPVAGNIDHNNLADLTVGDDHTQYALLAGRSGGQSLIGGTASGNNLTFRSSSHATKGKVVFGNAGITVYDEVNERMGIGTASPGTTLHLEGTECNVRLGNTTPTTGKTYYFRSLNTGTFDILHHTGNVAFSMDTTGYEAFGFGSSPSSTAGITLFTNATVGGTTGVHIQNNGTGSILNVVNNITTSVFSISQLGLIDISNITAGSPNFKITATSDTPTVAFTGGGNAPTTAPAGYLEILVGATPRYIPFWA